MRIVPACVVAVLPLASAAAARAAEAIAAAEPPLRVSLTLAFENDGSFVRENADSDRHETSAAGAILSFHGDAADPLFDALGLAHRGTAWGLVGGQRLFTPEVIDAPTRDPGDRPFAGYLYGGVFVQRELGDALDHLQLDLGIVGPSALGEETQSAVHDLIGEEDPNWIDQLGDELAAQLTYRREWRVPLGEIDAWGVPLGLRVLPRVGFGLGTVERYASAGVDVELGHRLGDSFSAGRLLAPPAATGAAVTGFRAGLFGRAGGSYVQWDTFLDGSSVRDPSASVSREPWRGELGGGFRFAWEGERARFAFEYLQLVLTDRFETQRTTDGVASASLRFEWAF
ncbi:lipid A deacylase LpxR family protein [Phycisphaera mikurensis]|uniref:Lipid A deacylase LpxR family protein n=1 Tax=Phycisphaera mikurensis (strain NBRC 102666 / KCTC 22515 / FYK2301M01) TaxID=1142394 RepID=I0IAV7_PHYMF|nr:lipid A deacylase LpxR family protein [Phycisphaera mikurensis]MBB6442631.1 hypothetical protein [Phycisphaera mikurensis]BAM02395.1 hypothetical protein PSMK_02360 [Phycisphaera mikurensis NBRC 102666]